VATYLSMHIIACMTRQALNELIATLQKAPDIAFIRASASQMAGRLLCEFEAPDQETLLRFLDAHHVTYEWIIRVELSWSGRAASGAPAQGMGAGSAPETAAAQQETPSEVPPQARVADAPAVPSASSEAAPASQGLEEVRAVNILHILRTLRDESAWQIIQAQRASESVAVLLMHDAVLAPPPLEVPMYACDADVQARGLSSALPRLTYDQIVALIFACERVMVW
jgi:sulfur transfer complex TusBCD TusB component (DsrH family)